MVDIRSLVGSGKSSSTALVDELLIESVALFDSVSTGILWELVSYEAEKSLGLYGIEALV